MTTYPNPGRKIGGKPDKVLPVEILCGGDSGAETGRLASRGQRGMTPEVIPSSSFWEQYLVEVNCILQFMYIPFTDWFSEFLIN